jgi:lysozyme family protein
MKENESISLDRVLVSEGGFRAGDPSMRGVRLTDCNAWRARRNLPPYTLDQLRAMPEEETRQFYLAERFVPIRFDEIVNGSDYCLLDFTVQDGLTGGMNTARTLLGTAVPLRHWAMDDALLAAINATGAKVFISALCGERWFQMQQREDFAAIGAGLGRRASSCYRWAMELTGVPPMTVKDRYAP